MRFVVHRLPPRPPRFPYTTLFRSPPSSGAPWNAPSCRVCATTSTTKPGSSSTGSPSTAGVAVDGDRVLRSEEHTSELQSHSEIVCRLLLEKKKTHARLAWRDRAHQ